MRNRVSLPGNVEHLVRRVLTADAATSPADLRRRVFEFVAALTRREAPPAIPDDMEPYIRKVALNAYKVLDREIDAMHAAGRTVDDVFEATVTASVSAGVTRMEIALAALEEVRDASAS